MTENTTQNNSRAKPPELMIIDSKDQYMGRSYTTGNKISARKMFVFNADGTIAGLADV